MDHAIGTRQVVEHQQFRNVDQRPSHRESLPLTSGERSEQRSFAGDPNGIEFEIALFECAEPGSNGTSVPPLDKIHNSTGASATCSGDTPPMNLDFWIDPI